MREASNKGFTIIELMVTMAVAAILLGFALPAYNNMIAQRNMTSRINDFVLAVAYARSEAARLGQPVSVRAVAPGAAGNEWGGGYCVVESSEVACNNALRSFDPIADATLNGVTGFNAVGDLTFNARGLMTLGAAGSVELCSTDPTVDPGRSANISVTGRPDVEELTCYP